MNEAPNILFIRLKSIGDVVLTLPAVNLARDHFPDSRITFLTSKENLPIASGFAAVNEIITLDRAALRRLNLKAVWTDTLGLALRLRRAKFTLAVDLQGYGETALLTWLTRAPQRWGSVYCQTRRWAYTRGVDCRFDTHPADWNLSLLRQCGLNSSKPARNEFHLAEKEIESARRFLAEHACDPGKPLLYLQPFTSSPHKNWPLEKHRQLARLWRQRGAQVIFGGGPGDRPALEPVRKEGFPISAGVPLLTTAGLMSLSSVVIGSDTGLIHLAVALGKRVVMLIRPHGPASPLPYQHPDWVVTPTGSQPVSSIGVDEVMAASVQALAETAATPNPSKAFPP